MKIYLLVKKRKQTLQKNCTEFCRKTRQILSSTQRVQRSVLYAKFNAVLREKTSNFFAVVILDALLKHITETASYIHLFHFLPVV